jgi:hypothetical protein
LVSALPAVDAAALAARLAATIFAPLAILVAARFRLLGHWTVPIWTRLTRAARRFPRLLALPATKSGARTPAARTAPGGSPPIRLPAGRAFLLERLRHEAACYTARLDALLNEPATVAALVAAPAALRALRPFCRLLGVDLPPALRPPRRPRAQRLPAPDPVLPSDSRLGRNLACPFPAPPPARAARNPAVPQDGCYCSNPSASPFWPFPRATAPPV